MSLLVDPEYAILRMRLALLRGHDSSTAGRVVTVPAELRDLKTAQASENEYVRAAAPVYAQLPTAVRNAQSSSPPVGMAAGLGVMVDGAIGYRAALGRNAAAARRRSRQSVPSNAGQPPTGDHSRFPSTAAASAPTRPSPRAAGTSVVGHEPQVSARPANPSTMPRPPPSDTQTLFSPQIDVVLPGLSSREATLARPPTIDLSPALAPTSLSSPSLRTSPATPQAPTPSIPDAQPLPAPSQALAPPSAVGQESSLSTDSSNLLPPVSNGPPIDTTGPAPHNRSAQNGVMTGYGAQETSTTANSANGDVTRWDDGFPTTAAPSPLFRKITPPPRSPTKSLSPGTITSPQTRSPNSRSAATSATAPSGASPSRPSALSALIHESGGEENPFAEYSKWSGLGSPTPLTLLVFVPTTHPPHALTLVLDRSATVEQAMGYALFVYCEEKRTPKLGEWKGLGGGAEGEMDYESIFWGTEAWEMRIVEDGGEVDEDFPVAALAARRPTTRSVSNSAPTSPSSSAPPLPVGSTANPAGPNPSPSGGGNDLVFLKIHLYSTLEVKQTTTLPFHRSTTLGDVFLAVCRKRKYDEKQYVFKMSDTKTDVAKEKRIDESEEREFCVLKRDRGGAGDIFLRPPDEVQPVSTTERPIMAEEFAGVYKQYLVHHRTLLGRSGRLLTLDGDHLHVTPVEGGGVFGTGKMLAPTSATFRITVFRGSEQKQQSGGGVSGGGQGSKEKETRVIELEAGSAQEAVEICGKISCDAQMRPTELINLAIASQRILERAVSISAAEAAFLWRTSSVRSEIVSHFGPQAFQTRVDFGSKEGGDGGSQKSDLRTEVPVRSVDGGGESMDAREVTISDPPQTTTDAPQRWTHTSMNFDEKRTLETNDHSEDAPKEVQANVNEKRATATGMSSLYLQEQAEMTPARVPGSRISRLWHYGNLFAGVAMGGAAEAVRRTVGAGSSTPNVLMSPQNVERVVKRLSRMRGAALKLGQMFSIQDNVMLPPEVEAILLRVQNAANFMPESQLQQVMRSELGDSWQSKFASFSLTPFAAASMGQVHRAVLLSGQTVAVKVQYPGVAESIDSDLDSLKSLLLLGNLLPRGLYLDKSIAVARKELAWEVDYEREADNMDKFAELLREDKHFKVPKTFRKHSTKRVLISEFVPGVPVHKLAEVDQQTRDRIGIRMLELCLRELFTYRFMQTDPNWSNFLYDDASETVYLVDFGAARTFSEKFTDGYLEVLQAAAMQDRAKIAYWSKELGFLTGLETEVKLRVVFDGSTEFVFM
ncbi:hypothetical protein HDU93_001626 [Gonapodya sp. JEL0774]|nr:hypothetical protein HDU93_001626 [Gonapodya sp. JEL0774]